MPARNLVCFSLGRAFVNPSAIMSSVGLYSSAITFAQHLLAQEMKLDIDMLRPRMVDRILRQCNASLVILKNRCRCFISVS